MKLLGWMHRKLRQNNTEQLKNFTTGNPTSCLSVQAFSNERHYLDQIKTFPHPQSNTVCKNSPNKIEADKSEVDFHGESFDPFGFLAIGTFGMELLNTDPPTPKFTVPCMNLTNEETEITNNDLELINYELEKFLEAEAKEIANDSSERSSQASIITLSNKQNEGADSDGTNTVPCPLQNYLFGSLIELAGTVRGAEPKKEKTSLGELFKRNAIHDDPKKKCEELEKEARGRYITRLMKKMVKNFHSTRGSNTVSSKGDAAESISIKRKLSKALKVFCTKVYPEEMTTKQFIKLQKGKIISHASGYQNAGGNKNKRLDYVDNIKNEKNTMKLFPTGIGRSASTMKGEHWIKTDTDYLVLEL